MNRQFDKLVTTVVSQALGLEVMRKTLGSTSLLSMESNNHDEVIRVLEEELIESVSQLNTYMTEQSESCPLDAGISADAIETLSEEDTNKMIASITNGNNTGLRRSMEEFKDNEKDNSNTDGIELTAIMHPRRGDPSPE